MSDQPGWKRQTLPKDGAPHAWIQWKGTSVCMDFRCLCGKGGHIDSTFAYYVRCVACGRTFMMNGHVEAVELTPEEASETGAAVTIRADSDNLDLE